MKHFTISTWWEARPGALVANLQYGATAGKQDAAVLPIHGVAVDAKAITYRWWDHDQQCYVLADAPPSGDANADKIRAPKLPTNGFVVSKSEGRYAIHPGRDQTPRLLLGVYADRPSRGDLSIEFGPRATTGRVIAHAQARSNRDGGIAAMVLLDLGQRIVFRLSGSKGCHYLAREWDGEVLRETEIPAHEWAVLVAPPAPIGEVI